MPGARTPSFAATVSADERSTGSSASAKGRAPSIPRSARSPKRYTPDAASSEQKPNRSPVVTPPMSQPSPPNAAARRATSATAFRRFSATARASLRVSGVVLDEAAGRPVRLGGVAAARAVERGDVLERDEDVTVQLDVRDVLEGAVR